VTEVLGDEVLKALSFNLGYWNCILGLFVLALFFRILSVIAIRKSIKKFQ